MKFHSLKKGKCKFLHLVLNSLRQQCRLRTNWLESSFAEEALDVLADKLDMNETWAFAA